MKLQDAIILMLSELGEAHYADVAREIQIRQLYHTKSKTFKTDVAGNLSWGCTEKGKQIFQRVEGKKGVYRLRSTFTSATITDTESTSTPFYRQDVVLESDQQQNAAEKNQWQGVCGFWWKRDQVDWKKAKPSILGMNGKDNRVVDFYNQIGIYLLFDEQKFKNLIYIGRTSDSLGARLQSHDKEKTRWTSFCWLGLKPVRNDGSLSDKYANVPAAELIILLEGFLIDSIRPHSNQKSGDSIRDSEYKQVVVQR